MTPDEIKAEYLAALDEVGETITIRRFTGTGPNRPKFEVDVRARVTGYTPNEMVAGIEQKDRKAIVLHEDLVAGGIALPLTNSDKAVYQGKEYSLRVADAATRRVAGVTIAYELVIVG